MGLSITGMRFAHPITQVLDGLIGLRGDVKALQLALLARFVACEAATIVDQTVVLGDRSTQGRPLATAYEAFHERRRRMRAEQRRDPAIDTDCDVVLFPQGGHTLAMLLGDLDGVDALLEGIGAEDWSWGLYERPDRVDEATWKAREADWTAAMGGDAHWIPSHRGLRYSYTDPLLSPPDVDGVLAALPTPIARATEMARREVARRAAQNAQPGEDPFQVSLRAMWDRPAIAAHRDRLLPLLPTLTAEVLQHGLPTA